MESCPSGWRHRRHADVEVGTEITLAIILVGQGESDCSPTWVREHSMTAARGDISPGLLLTMDFISGSSGFIIHPIAL